MLGIDEVSLVPGEKIDPSTNCIVGYVTIPNGQGKTNLCATNGMIFMLGGIFERWKQIVAYHFTNPKGFDGTRLKPIIEEIIQKAEKLGLYVHAVTSDMGASNQRIWRAFGINTHKYSTIKNSVPHPIDPQRRFFFFADGPHLLKNLRTALINNRSIILPSNYVEILNLSSSVVQCSHLEELVAE